MGVGGLQNRGSHVARGAAPQLPRPAGPPTPRAGAPQTPVPSGAALSDVSSRQLCSFLLSARGQLAGVGGVLRQQAGPREPEWHSCPQLTFT